MFGSGNSGPKDDENIGSWWLSESGVIDLFLFFGKKTINKDPHAHTSVLKNRDFSPTKRISTLFHYATGFPAMPPMF